METLHFNNNRLPWPSTCDIPVDQLPEIGSTPKRSDQLPKDLGYPKLVLQLPSVVPHLVLRWYAWSSWQEKSTEDFAKIIFWIGRFGLILMVWMENYTILKTRIARKEWRIGIGRLSRFSLGGLQGIAFRQNVSFFGHMVISCLKPKDTWNFRNCPNFVTSREAAHISVVYACIV